MVTLILAGVGVLALATAVILALAQARRGEPEALRGVGEAGIGVIAMFAWLILAGAIAQYWQGIGGLIACSAIFTGVLGFVLAGAAWRIQRAALSPDRMELLRFAGDGLLGIVCFWMLGVPVWKRVNDNPSALPIAIVCAWLLAPLLYRRWFQSAEPWEARTSSPQAG